MERRRAADWVYHADAADELMARWTGESHELGRGAMRALAIDPEYAPALLTVGSLEYQYGRADEAMALFMRMVALPLDQEDLPQVVDKAGAFLTDCGDFPNAKRLFKEAVRTHPDIALFRSALGYCHGKLGDLQEAVVYAREAVELDPGNHEYLSDLGWALIQAGEYQEAKRMLEKAIAASPPGYETALANLSYLDSLRAG